MALTPVKLVRYDATTGKWRCKLACGCEVERPVIPSKLAPIIAVKQAEADAEVGGEHWNTPWAWSPHSVRAHQCRKENPTPRKATSFGRPTWFELFDANGDPNAELRDRLRGKSAVYVLRERAGAPVEYVGSSEPGSAPRGAWGTRKAKKGPDPARTWKTILRHFHACRTRSSRRSSYSFGDDNVCTTRRAGWQVAVFVCPAAQVRDRELEAIAHFEPRYQKQQALDLQQPADEAPAWERDEGGAFDDLLR